MKLSNYFKLLVLFPVFALISCSNGGGGDDPVDPAKFMLSSETPTVVEDYNATVYIDWKPSSDIIKFKSFTFTSEPSKECSVEFKKESDFRPMPVTIKFNDLIDEDISGTLSFTYEDITAKTKGTSRVNVTINKPELVPLSFKCLSETGALYLKCVNKNDAIRKEPLNLTYSINGSEFEQVNVPESADSKVKIADLKQNDIVSLLGTNPNGFSINDKETSNDSIYSFSTEDNDSFQVFGNIRSLIMGTKGLPENAYFWGLFAKASIVDARELSLPFKTITMKCYAYMFSECTKLKKAPMMLPALTLPESCYKCMFNNCSSLVEPPKEISGTTLTGEDNCFRMFHGCGTLQVAPLIKANNTTSGCFYEMFLGTPTNKTAKTGVLYFTAPSTIEGTLVGYKMFTLDPFSQLEAGKQYYYQLFN